MPSEFEIVGVVEDLKLLAGDVDDDAMFFIPWTQGPLTDLSIIVRTTDEPALRRALPAVVRAVDPSLPLDHVSTVEEQIATLLGQPRFTAIVVTFFGAIALLLAMTGVYGLLAENVLQQTRAFGIRMAFGARAVDVFALVVREGLVLLALGSAMGLATSWLVIRVLRHVIANVDPGDAIAYAGIFAVLGCATLTACAVPALRASRIDPSIALRHE